MSDIKRDTKYANDFLGRHWGSPPNEALSSLEFAVFVKSSATFKDNQHLFFFGPSNEATEYLRIVQSTNHHVSRRITCHGRLCRHRAEANITFLADNRANVDRDNNEIMNMSVDVTFDIVTASICATLILVRCGYRLFSRCRIHDSCHRTWHADDAYMAFAIVPLIGRTTCIALSFVLNPTHTFGLPTSADAAAQGLTVEQVEENYIISHKLLIPSRIFYAMFLWSLKLCLLNFYSRFVDVFHWGKVATTALWWFIVITFFIVLIPTLAECRPLSLMWLPDPNNQNFCHRAVGNLVTMAVFNIITDIALIIFPFPILRHVKLDGKVKAQLILLFSIAGLIVVITIMRLPMILNQAVSQRSRSMWASIEILCACIVANTAFFYALLKDYQRGHDTRVTGSGYARQPDFYMQAIPSPDMRRGLSLALLLSALETTIVATTLTTIGAHFNDYNKIGWVVTAYLVTNSGFILTYSKLTDIFGQRNVLLFALAWFALFSGLCAASQSMTLTHLIVFRALQGVGASGIFSTVFVSVIDICPARWIGPYSAAVSSIFALASILGPIVGGVISDTGDWKWIFLLNVPGAAIAGSILLFYFPQDDTDFGKSIFRRIDFIGSLLSIGSAVMLLYGLQTGGAEHPWSDGRIVGTIVAGGVSIVIFVIYEWFIQRNAEAVIEPVLPLRLFKNPRVTCLLLTAFFQGSVFYPVVINIPQLNQIVHHNSATMAGIRLMPLLLVSSFFSMIAGIMLSKTTRFGWQTIAVGSCISLIGVGLLIELPFDDDVLARTYGYEVVIGIGLGIAMPVLMILGRVEVEDRDNAVMMGAFNTIRTMGGCISLSVCSAILHSEMPERLKSLPENAVEAILSSPTTVLPRMDKEIASMVRRTYNDVYRLQWIAVTVLAVVQVFFAFPPLFLRAKHSAPESAPSRSMMKKSEEIDRAKVSKEES
ncbi:major facilitator superfamily transporter [Colletotrichum karsti]|uniref:Major facilitator superfamily transporter n=1 Tax=Colletotrichum karsti TaxID=1095194 RepID=A0A9P6LEI2_9PEZI|nr:major facilitator superfamily transporter [Colletotrichum karsti]KAF9870448.1 major facilitator superfamily transporter [Colletotrichum karsti]